MFSNVFFKTLYDMRKSLMWWAILMFLFSLYYMALFPSLQESSEDIQSYIDNLPDSMMALMGGEMDMTTVNGFLAAEAFSFFYPIFLLAFGIAYGTGLMGGEEESRTLEVLLATPIARWRVVLEKFAALVVFTAVVLLSIYLGFVAGALVSGVDEMSYGDVLAGTYNMLPLTLFFAALAQCLLAVRGGRGSATGIAAGLAAGTYLLHSMAEVAGIPEWLQRISPWYYYNGARAIVDGFSTGNVILLLALGAALVGVSLWGFQRRDLGV
ncbi:MAG TPA: ABC transporter permease subunit [Aggregatilinea sp.]|jgi:ABC-2 type transport system permease protein|uniref:ABC transporter permease subunit n=1 Tax=Aggregatilinea sp. TaxID=2806333 RepID=UPI002C0137C3|nr:ABC transporter permease subunit [Aggregatilinea sp.]HML22674.1 ABC transporter permease subunit [Aggregatilinea sp.]